MKQFLITSLLFGLAHAAHAQTPSQPPTATDPKTAPIQPESPAAPAVVPANAAVPVPGVVNPVAVPRVAPGRQGVNPNAIICPANDTIGGENLDDQDVANDYRKYTGKRVLLSSATQAMEIRFVQHGPLTNRQAAELLVKVLDMEGYVFVPSGANEVKLLPKAQGTGANGPGELEGIIDNPADIPEGDDYISYFMKLGFIKPEEAVRTFTQSVHGLGPGAKIAPVPNASAVLITGKATFVRKLINQQRYIDVAAGNVATAWVQLKFADAEELATTLNEVMNAQQQRKTTAGVTTGATATRGRTPIPGTPTTGRTGTASTANASAQSGSAAGEDIPVQIVASPRLNKIFIMGRPVDIVFVEGLAREFDAPPNKNNFIKRKLRFMIASDFLEVAANALEAAAGPTATGQGSGARNTRQTTQNRNQNTNRNQNQGNQNGNRSNVDSVEAFDVSDVPESLVVGKTFIVADNLANSILVQGPPESLRIVSELIDKLDGRPQQVMISTVFGQVTLGNERDVGVSAGRTNLGERDDIAGSSNAGGLLQNLTDLGTVAGLNTAAGTAAGLNIYGRINDITAVIRALESKTDFKVLSRPTVYTANNRVAVISSGRRIAVPTNTFTSGGNAVASQSTNIEYRDVLLRFEVVPLINSEEEVTLRISLLNEDTQGSQIIDGNTIPTIVTESISTTVTVPNNSTVVLGGLVTESTRNTKSGVPILSRIPALGRLFSRTTKNVDRRELLIFIQPKIVSGEESQNQAQTDMDSRYEVAKPTRDFANGVLPGKPAVGSSSQKEKPIPAASKRPYLRYPTRR
ncbi:MAG: type II secretion system protein GspD [Akkermansiaceae bacterium]